MAEFSRQYFLAPVLLLTFISVGGVFIRSSTTQNNESSPRLKGTVTKVHRLSSWLKERVPWSTSGNTNTYEAYEVNATLNVLKTWVGHSSNHNHTHLLIDVVSTGSSSRKEYLRKQRETWASPQFVRNMIMANEINTEAGEDVSCERLELACSKSVANLDAGVAETEIGEEHEPAVVIDDELCIQRRFGLAMGASVRRYRKIEHEFNLINDTTLTKGAELPNFLIVTFYQMSYNTSALKECKEEKPQIYAPIVSWRHITSRSNDKYPDSFPYPTNRTGLIFNRAAMQRWMEQIPCFYDDTIANDAGTFESNICSLVRASSTESHNEFDSLLVQALELSKRDSDKDNFSVSDIFFMYSQTVHLLCKSQHNKVVPSGEEMLGYLIHRFQVSDSPIDQNECMNIEPSSLKL